MTDSLKHKTPQQLSIEDFPARSRENVRFSDVDCLGHVNNTVFASFLETGRVNIFWDREGHFELANSMFVVAHLSLDFIAEITWPGEVEIGTGIVRLGRSSITMYQGIFQQQRCVATAETVIVAMDPETRSSRPLDEKSRHYFNRFILS
ncbi:acyl-CoA thioesterase [Gynuella sunshinyii]|uniref:Putative thioesterase n=1 Tax=Gynuella sunshinyii YC6258 TaxID=1445510 RepID=A0A0C5VH25_9GAMM|nr:thioesterase family protein [Gynuella sunshinyii]AJQ93932.1 putative thioesterase [Gynuella sunshinyii YC6258]